VLHDLDLAVEAGEVFGLLGPNGAGKTTTIKLVTALLFPDRGQVRIDGRDVRRPEARRALGYLPENPYFYDYLTGREFLDFYGCLYGLGPGERRRRAGELLEQLGLAAAAGMRLRRYSKGMLQRLGFAQALLGRPRLLVLDEPMSGLDPVGRRDFRDLILQSRDRGATVFFSSHILQDAEMICDRVAILVAGRLRSVVRLDQLLGAAGAGYEVTVEGVGPGELDGSEEVLARLEGRLLVRTRSLEEAEALAERARRRGGRLTALVPARATLEDLFLRHVGEAQRPGEGA
jgi:ABC-2 type transport system ATP-binding protein